MLSEYNLPSHTTKDEGDMQLYTPKEKFEYLNLSAILVYTNLIFDKLPRSYWSNASYYDTLHPFGRFKINQFIQNVENQELYTVFSSLLICMHLQVFLEYAKPFLLHI
jgi:hypothetical protein